MDYPLLLPTPVPELPQTLRMEREEMAERVRSIIFMGGEPGPTREQEMLNVHIIQFIQFIQDAGRK